MGMQSLCEDMNEKVNIVLRCDATAGKGIAERRGVGKVRHLHVGLLWLQRHTQRGTIKIEKCDGKFNVSDIGTKHVEGILMRSHLQRMGFRTLVGRSSLALRAAL